MEYVWQFSVVGRNLPALLRGLLVTLVLTGAAISAGQIIGVLWAGMRSSRSRMLRGGAWLMIELFRDLPVLVLLVWMYFCLPLFLGDWVRISPFWVGVIGLGLNYAALQAEILRAGYESIPHGQLEVAESFGFTKLQRVRHLILPQAFWRSLPPTLGQIVNTLKLSALAAFIAVPEMFYITQKLIQESFRPLEFYTALAGMYLLLVAPLALLFRALEVKISRRFQQSPVGI